MLYRQDCIVLSMVHKQINYKNIDCELISIQRRNQVQSLNWLQDIPVTRLLLTPGKGDKKIMSAGNPILVMLTELGDVIFIKRKPQ